MSKITHFNSLDDFPEIDRADLQFIINGPPPAPTGPAWCIKEEDLDEGGIVAMTRIASTGVPFDGNPQKDRVCLYIEGFAGRGGIILSRSDAIAIGAALIKSNINLVE